MWPRLSENKKVVKRTITNQNRTREQNDDGLYMISFFLKKVLVPPVLFYASVQERISPFVHEPIRKLKKKKMYLVIPLGLLVKDSD